MVKRRDFLKAGFAVGSSGVVAGAKAQAGDNEELLKYLCPPDNMPDQLASYPSPPATPFVAKLVIPEIMKPVPEDQFLPKPDPEAHQRYKEFLPQVFYEIRQKEFQWEYHPSEVYKKVWSWGFQDKNSGKMMTPGPTYHARYGEPVLVRMVNDLPAVGQSKATFALPSTAIHLHNGHTASESDGNPQDWIDSGEFWDHHYANFPSGFDAREKLTTLWYHDHRLDFTAANVYAGLSGFYLLFDERDTGNENDTSPLAWRLPSGEFDIPLMIHDVKFINEEKSKLTGKPVGQVDFSGFITDGWLGDMVTINRKIRPYLDVQRRKYRFRIVNGGPSRFYQLRLRNRTKNKTVPMCVISGDGNLLPEPVWANSIYYSVAQRTDVIIDFKQFEPGDDIVLENTIEQTNGKGPSGRELIDGIMKFNIQAGDPEDPSRIPDKFRERPEVDMSLVKHNRLWTFDYDGGLWTINGRVMDPNRIDAGIEQGSAEIWTFRNGGNDWAHPIHSHFTEFILLEVNGRKVLDRYYDWENYYTLDKDDVRYGQQIREGFGKSPLNPIHRFMGGPRRDVATLLPNDEVVVYMRWFDFLGKHVMHCHNVVHEDHAMMVRWDIMEPGRGFTGPRTQHEVYGTPELESHNENRPGQSSIQESTGINNPKKNHKH